MKIKSDVTGLVKYDPSRKKFVFEYGGIIYRYYNHFVILLMPEDQIGLY